jgi:hypothetical protein
MNYEESSLKDRADFGNAKRKNSQLMKNNSSKLGKFESSVLKKLLSVMVDQYNRIRESYKGVVHSLYSHADTEKVNSKKKTFKKKTFNECLFENIESESESTESEDDNSKDSSSSSDSNEESSSSNNSDEESTSPSDKDENAKLFNKTNLLQAHKECYDDSLNTHRQSEFDENTGERNYWTGEVSLRNLILAKGASKSI